MLNIAKYDLSNIINLLCAAAVINETQYSERTSGANDEQISDLKINPVRGKLLTVSFHFRHASLTFNVTSHFYTEGVDYRGT